MSKDALSALIDGECTGPELDRLLDEMDHAPELARRWSRMVLAREVRMGTQIKRRQPCICADVMGHLEAESEHPKLVDLAVRKASTMPSPRARTTPSRLVAFWKPAAGFAAAASMGAAAVLLVQPQTGQQVEDAGPMHEMGVVAGFQNVNAGARAQQVGLDSDERTRDEQYRRMLREYLVNHSHSIAGEGMGSTMGFTRIVAHTTDDRRQNDESR